MVIFNCIHPAQLLWIPMTPVGLYVVIWNKSNVWYFATKIHTPTIKFHTFWVKFQCLTSTFRTLIVRFEIKNDISFFECFLLFCWRLIKAIRLRKKGSYFRMLNYVFLLFFLKGNVLRQMPQSVQVMQTKDKWIWVLSLLKEHHKAAMR